MIKDYCSKCGREISHKGLCIKCYKKDYSKRHSKEIVEKKRLWRFKNPDKFKQQVERHNKTKNHLLNCKRYSFKNKDKLTKKARERYKKNPEKYIRRVKQCADKNKDKIKSRNYSNRNKMLLKDRCEVCGNKKNLEKHHKDYNKQEIITTCGRCNIQIKVNNLEGKDLEEIKNFYNKNGWKV